MMDQITRTTRFAPGNNRAFRERLGLQFFAGDGEGDASGEADAFLEGLAGDMEPMDDGGGDQAAGESSPDGEGGPDGGDQTGGQTAEDSEPEDGGLDEGGPEAGQSGGGQPAGAPDVLLRVMDRQISLPGDAVNALSGALGTDAAMLLQKGMNYENRGAREIGILSDYARAAGMELPQYLDALERDAKEQALGREVERVRGQYPEGTPDEALRTIAQNNLRARREEEAEAAARRQRDEQAQRDMQRVQAVSREMQPFLQAHPEIRGASDVPPVVWDMVQRSQGGISLPAAYAMYERDEARAEAEQLREQLAAEKKMNENKQKSAGSQAGGGDSQDAFLAGLFAD